MDHFQSMSHSLLPYTEDLRNPFEISVKELCGSTDFINCHSNYPFPGSQNLTEPILMRDYQRCQWEVAAASGVVPISGSAFVTSTFTDSDFTSSQIYHHSQPNTSDINCALDQLYAMSVAASPADAYPSLSATADTFDFEPQVEAEINHDHIAASLFGSSVPRAQPSQIISPSVTLESGHGLGGHVFSWPIPPNLRDAATNLATSNEFLSNLVIPTHLLRPFLKKIRHALEVRIQSNGKGSRNGAFAYKCLWNNCGRITTRQDHALDHIAQHLGSKPHKCPHCSLRFLRLADCKRHARSIEHGGAKSDSVSLEGLEVWEQCHTMGEFSVPLTWETFARLVRGVARFLKGRSR